MEMNRPAEVRISAGVGTCVSPIGPAGDEAARKAPGTKTPITATPRIELGGIFNKFQVKQQNTWKKSINEMTSLMALVSR